MKLRLSLFLASASLLLVAVRVESARRPAYGGTLRVEIGAIVTSLDPAVPPANPEEAAAKEQLDALMYGGRTISGTFTGVAGSGPFRISAWNPGKLAFLAANDDFRGGRPFVDSVEIQMGRAAKDRLLDLELNRADFAEIPAEQARAAAAAGIRVSISAPDELLAMVLAPNRPATDDARVREALALSIDRAALVNFILQKTGEPAGGLLPQWSSGTAFLFSSAPDQSRAKELATQAGAASHLALGYDATDALEQQIAERIAVDSRNAGLTLDAQRIGGSAEFDARLVRMRMASPNPREALARFVALLNPLAGLAVAPPADAASSEQVFAAERAVVASGRVIPLAWLPRVYGLGPRVRDWRVPASGGGWPFADVWLDGAAEAAADKGNP